jgi:shikimate kinase
MRIYLIGYMGSGKTSVGCALAKRLQLPFFDLDSRITANVGRSIADIFSHDGEDYFRQQESRALEEIIETSSACVLATGGGTPCFGQNLSRMHASGLTFYLSCSVSTLQSRLTDDASQRPILGLEGFNLEEHLSNRIAFYSQAQHIISNDGTIEQAVEQIVLLYEAHRPSA